MAVITPTITLRSNASTATTNAGPLTVALSLAGSDILTVDNVKSEIVTPANSGAPTLLIDAPSSLGATPGTHGGFLYLKNITSTGDHKIYIGGVQAGQTDPADMGDTGSTVGTHTALDNPDDASVRWMTLLPGEFAFFPIDYMQDIYCGASAASQTLEYWLFDRG
tara:strand:- start:1542 stop:2036 length:495 start_codon:yes stop_codon:yes gene_type:complete